MKLITALTLMTITTTTSAAPLQAVGTRETNVMDDYHLVMPTTRNRKEVKIKWVTVDSTDKVCADLVVKAGHPRPKYGTNGCSTWSHNSIGVDTCTIYTKKNTTMGTVGHEVMHCFQGEFHKYIDGSNTGQRAR